MNSSLYNDGVGFDGLRKVVDEICRSALQAVNPERSVSQLLSREDEVLKVGEYSYSLRDRNVFLTGTGKAGVPMARAVEGILLDKLCSGLIVVKYDHGGDLKKTAVLEAGHPEPDEQGEKSAQRLVTFLKDNVTESDLLFVLISGGGSALLPAPVSAISFEEKRQTSASLLRCGATIQEFNTIRKHISKVKGGRLLDYVQGAEVVSLLLSDVVGDDVASIASGPTAPDPTTFEQCLEIIQKYAIESEIPKAVLRYLQAGSGDDITVCETPKPGDRRFAKVRNIVAGSNIQALQAAAEKAHSLGFSPLILSSSITGNTADAAESHVAIAREVLSTGNPISPPCCIISGGETTVRVKGTGKGGRNQEFVLWCAHHITDWDHPAIFVSIGSDGNDGPTDAAGAIASPETVRRAEKKGLSIKDYLERNDSYHFFQKLDDLIITGPTQTNVMDLRFMLIGGS